MFLNLTFLCKMISIQFGMVLLFSLLEEVLDRFERENGGHLLVATLCLLEASSGGLQESELLDILANEEELVPPSPYEEKGK